MEALVFNISYETFCSFTTFVISQEGELSSLWNYESQDACPPALPSRHYPLLLAAVDIIESHLTGFQRVFFLPGPACCLFHLLSGKRKIKYTYLYLKTFRLVVGFIIINPAYSYAIESFNGWNVQMQNGKDLSPDTQSSR